MQAPSSIGRSGRRSRSLLCSSARQKFQAARARAFLRRYIGHSGSPSVAFGSRSSFSWSLFLPIRRGSPSAICNAIGLGRCPRGILISRVAQNDTFTLGATFPCVFFHLWSISVDLSPFSRPKTAFLLGFGTIYIKRENSYARIVVRMASVGHRAGSVAFQTGHRSLLRWAPGAPPSSCAHGIENKAFGRC